MINITLDELINYLYIVENKMASSIELNYQKWYSNLDANISTKNLQFLNNYLLYRKILLDELWT